ncbi:MAG: T9SS type A sorting domain-containing protein [Bacteroidota bacterium]
MNMIPFIRQGSVLLVALVLCSSLQAQQRQTSSKHNSLRLVEQFGEELDLSEEQILQVTDLKEEMRDKMRATKQAGQQADRQQMKAIKEEYEAKVNAILSVEQQEELQQIATAKKAQSEDRRANRRAMQQELRNYHETNIQPVILESRQKLEQKISSQDRQSIDDLRLALAAHKKKQKAERKANRQNKGQMESHRSRKGKGKAAKKGRQKGLYQFLQQNVESQSIANQLIDTYSNDIDLLNKEIAAQEAQWKADKEAIIERHTQDLSENSKAEFRKKRSDAKERHKTDIDRMKKLAFLMMDPKGEAAAPRQSDAEEDPSIKVYPNPSNANQTLEFETKTAGNVWIDILDSNGKTVQQVYNGYRDPGKHVIDVNVQGLDGTLHYYRINDPDGQRSQKVIITKE